MAYTLINQASLPEGNFAVNTLGTETYVAAGWGKVGHNMDLHDHTSGKGPAVGRLNVATALVNPGDVFINAGLFTFRDNQGTPANHTLADMDTAQTLTNKTLGSGSAWNGGVVGVSYGGTGATTLAGAGLQATGSKLVKVAEQFFQGTISASTGTVGAYLDAPAGFALTAACNAGDRVVCLLVAPLGFNFASGSSGQALGSLLVDKDSGTKLPATGNVSPAFADAVAVSASAQHYYPAALTVVDDGVTAGNHTYKPQGYANTLPGSATLQFGGGMFCLFKVEVWR